MSVTIPIHAAGVIPVDCKRAAGAQDKLEQGHVRRKIVLSVP